MLLRRLAVGGMAELFLAEDSATGEQVVIKRILPYLSHEPEFVQMFLDEARIAAQLHQENIIRVHELGKLQDSIFIAMEFVDGIDLRKILQEEVKLGLTVPYGVAAYVTAEIAAGLHCAHNATGVDGKPLGVIHRDVSPQNVMVGYDGRIKLVDFGIAKAGALMERSKPGVIKGKFLYLSPEQLSQERIDHRADLFALGTMLYELTTGKSPFYKPTTEAVIYSIRSEEPPPPTLLRSDYPQELSRVVMKCLVKDRTRRYQQGEEIQRDLMDFVAAKFPTDANVVAEYIRRLFGSESATKIHTPVKKATGRHDSTMPLPSRRSGSGEEPKATQPLPGRRGSGNIAPQEPASTLPLPRKPSSSASQDAIRAAPLSRRPTTPAGQPIEDPGDERPTTLAGAEDVARMMSPIVALPSRKASGPRYPSAGATAGEDQSVTHPPGDIELPGPPRTQSEPDITLPPQVQADDDDEPEHTLPLPARAKPAPLAALRDDSGPVFDTTDGHSLPKRSAGPDEPSLTPSTQGPFGEDEEDSSTATVSQHRAAASQRAAPPIDQAGASRRRLFVALIVAAVLLLSAAAALFWLIRRQDAPPPPPPPAAAAAPAEPVAPPPEPKPEPAAAEAPAAEAPPAAPAPVEAPKPPPPEVHPKIVFEAPRGTLVIHAGLKIPLGEAVDAEEGQYEYQFRCPGKHMQKGVVRVASASGKPPVIVSLSCRGHR